MKQLTTTQETINQITRLHNEVIGNIKASFEKAVEIGDLLKKQKKELGHGKFINWITNNLPFSERTARNYITLHSNRHLLKTESVSDLTSGYKLLRKTNVISQTTSDQSDLMLVNENPQRPTDDANFIDWYAWSIKQMDYIKATEESAQGLMMGAWEIKKRLEKSCGKLIIKFQEQFGEEATSLITKHLGEFYYYLMGEDTKHSKEFSEITVKQWTPPEYVYDLIDIKACLLWLREQKKGHSQVRQRASI